MKFYSFIEVIKVSNGGGCLECSDLLLQKVGGDNICSIKSLTFWRIILAYFVCFLFCSACLIMVNIIETPYLTRLYAEFNAGDAAILLMSGGVRMEMLRINSFQCVNGIVFLYEYGVSMADCFVISLVATSFLTYIFGLMRRNRNE